MQLHKLWSHLIRVLLLIFNLLNHRVHTAFHRVLQCMHLTVVIVNHLHSCLHSIWCDMHHCFTVAHHLLVCYGVLELRFRKASCIIHLLCAIVLVVHRSWEILSHRSLALLCCLRCSQSVLRLLVIQLRKSSLKHVRFRLSKCSHRVLHQTSLMKSLLVSSSNRLLH